MNYQIFRYEIPFIFPIRIGSGICSIRTGLYVKSTNNNGVFGWGEIAPLDGYGPDTLGEVLEKLKGPIQGYTEAMRFGFDCADREIVAQEKGCTFRDTFGPLVRPTIPSAQLILTAEDVRAPHLKTKVGAASIAQDVERVSSILKAVPKGGSLRLDANGIWTASEAFQFAAALGQKCDLSAVQIDFIEEPWKGCFEPADKGAFQDQTEGPDGIRVGGPFPFPVAIDESFSISNTTWKQADVVVIKPGLFGTIDEFWRIQKEATSNDQRVVISSAFETYLGMSALIALASSIPSSFPSSVAGNAEGLGTYRYLNTQSGPLRASSRQTMSNWLIQPEISVAGLPDIPGSLVDEHALTRVSSFDDNPSNAGHGK